MQVIAKEGTYFVRQKFGSTKACGIYIAGYHNESVRVDFIKVDVTYNDGGVVAVSVFYRISMLINRPISPHQ